MSEISNRCRINAYMSKTNYKYIDELMETHKLFSKRLSKGLILDLAISNLFASLDVGETLESIAIQHLERVGDENIETLNPEGDADGF